MKHKSRRKKSSAKATNPTKQNNTVTKDERDLKSMKEWIKSLTFESLVDALAFKFHTTEDETGSSTSHEFDLLLEMSSSRQQSPDNMSHRMGSEYSLDSNPCLFRWRVIDDTEIEKESEGSITKSDANKTQTSVPPVDPLASILGAGTTGLPSELLDVLAQAGVKRSTSALLETFNEVDELDEAFNSLEDCQNNMKQNINDTHQSSPPLPTNFSIQHGILDNGTFLCATIEQQNADRSILSWASLMRDRQLNTGGKKNNQIKSTLPKCILNIPNDPAKEDEKQHKKILLDSLHVVSRGKFLSSAGEQRRTYLAPWFDPTQEWFSLPMYLASRFEASLWDAYLHHSVIQTDEILRENDSLVHSVKSLDADAIERVLYHAFGLAMRNEISESINNLSSSSTTSDTIQEMLLWQLLSCNENGNQLTKTSERWDDFAITPLLEWGSPQSKLKCYIVEYLHEGLAHEAERSLIQSTSLECCCQNPKTSKKKKKRPKKKSHSNQSAAKKVNDIVHQREYDQSSEDDDDEPRVESIIHPTSTPSTQPEFSDSRMADHPPESEINSAKMTVLKVLDDILNDVFTRLCVQGDDFLDFTDTNSLTVKSRGGSSPLRELKRRKPVSVDKTLSADDLEEAATAVVSNIGSSVNAAMDFLQSNVRTPSQSSVQSQQLWASRIRRPSLAETDKHNEPTRLKRSMSSGDSSMLKKPPVHSNISNQPTRAHSGERGSVLSSSGSPLFLQDSQNETSIFDGAPLCLSGALDGWNGVASKNQPEETSIITDLLNTASPDTDQVNLASSTAASIASSVEDAGLDIELLEYDDLGVILDVKTNPLPQDRDVSPMPHDTPTLPDKDVSPPPSAPPTPPATVSPILVSLADLGKLRKEAVVAERQAQETEEDEKLNTKPPLFSGTPPKVLSPTASRPALKPSRSRDDLRSIDEYRKPHRRDRDDHHTLGHRQVDALLSYRNVVAKSVPRKPPSIKSYDGKQKHRDDTFPNMGRSTRSIRTTRSSIGWSPGPAEFPSLISSVTSMPKVLHLDVVCARSESGLDGVDDASHCNVIPRAQADDTLTKDGATTISSVNSPQRDAEQTEQAVSLKEERDAYRDMCLTLGAENAKLRNLLASATCTPLYNPTTTYPQEVSPYFYPNNGEQQPWPIHNQFPNQFTSHSIVAMSDAGHRVDYESSAMSEDDGTSDHMHPSVVAIESQSISWQARGDSVAHSFSRRTSAGGTYAESDTSLEHNIGQESYAFSGLNRVHHHDSLYGPTPLHGIESRLSKDITRYMIALQSQLKKTENVRLRAVEAMTKTIKVSGFIDYLPYLLNY